MIKGDKGIANQRETLSKAKKGNIESIEELAFDYYKSGEYVEAIYWRERAYAYYRNQYGISEASTLKALYLLGKALRRAKNYEYALDVYNVLYNICRKKYGEAHHGTLLAANVLANCYYDLSFFRNVYKLYKQVYQSCFEVLGEEHCDTIDEMENYANACLNVGDLKNAFKLAKKLNIIESKKVVSLNMLAYIHQERGHYKKAQEILKELREKEDIEKKNNDYIDDEVIENAIEERTWFFNWIRISFYLNFLSTIYRNNKCVEESTGIEQCVMDQVDAEFVNCVGIDVEDLIKTYIEEINRKDYRNIRKLEGLIDFLENFIEIALRYKPTKKGTISCGLASLVLRIMELRGSIQSCDYSFANDEHDDKPIHKDDLIFGIDEKDEKQKILTRLYTLADNTACGYISYDRKWTFTVHDVQNLTKYL